MSGVRRRVVVDDMLVEKLRVCLRIVFLIGYGSFLYIVYSRI